MSIFKIRSKKGKSTEAAFFGMQLPQSVSNFLTLYSLSNGVAKSVIMRNLLSDWIVDKKNVVNEDDLIRKIANITLQQWNNSKSLDDASSFAGFVEEVRAELLEKQLLPAQVNKIIKIVESEKNKK